MRNVVGWASLGSCGRGACLWSLGAFVHVGQCGKTRVKMMGMMGESIRKIGHELGIMGKHL